MEPRRSTSPPLPPRLVQVLAILSISSICIYLGILSFNSKPSTVFIETGNSSEMTLSSGYRNFVGESTQDQGDHQENSSDRPNNGEDTEPDSEEEQQTSTSSIDSEDTPGFSEEPSEESTENLQEETVPSEEETPQISNEELNQSTSDEGTQNSEASQEPSTETQPHEEDTNSSPSESSTDEENTQTSEDTETSEQAQTSEDTPGTHEDKLKYVSKWLTKEYLDKLYDSLALHDYISMKLSSEKITQTPQLPEDLSCHPSVFGYTQEQADRLFSPDVKFEQCGNPDNSCMEFMAATNELILTSGEAYALGTGQHDEQLGGPMPPFEWKPYTGPVPMKNTEFAYADCHGTTQTLLVNKPKAAAKERAANITTAISEALQVTPRPLSVITIMYDSMSRYHFFRNFKKSIEYLNTLVTDSNDATVVYDFVLNNVNGENTSPNVIPIMWGRDLPAQYKRAQAVSDSTVPKGEVGQGLQEDALWKHFEAHGFVTMFAYDASWDFIIKATGRNISVDHPVFNFWKGAGSIYSYHEDSTKQRCFGLRDSSFYMLDYVEQFVRNYDGMNRFAYMHLSTAHEPTGTVIRTVDEDNRNTLKQLVEHFQQRPEEDFIIMLVADHGLKVMPWEENLEGYKENQLPGAFVVANQRLMNSLDAHHIFQRNSRRLTSRIDWHLTYKQLATVPYGKLLDKSPVYQGWKEGREPFHSMLIEENEPERTCQSLRIPFHVCSCLDYEEPDSERIMMDPSVGALAELGIAHVNKKNKQDNTEGVCQVLTPDLVVMLHTTEIYPEGELTSYRARVSVSQSPTVFFDVMGFGTTVSDRAQESPFVQTTSELNPLWHVEGADDIVQVTKVERVDSYKGLCEELAKIMESNSPFCICEKPLFLEEANFTDSPKLTQLYTTLLSRLEIHISEPGSSCDDTCEPLYKSCKEWGLQMLDSRAVLQYAWPDGHLAYYDNGNKGLLSELWIEDAPDSEALTLDSNGVLYLGWISAPNCGLAEPDTRYICPCG